MPWNPEIYNRYKDIRFKPFYDLLTLIEEVPDMKGIDLGCGTGEQTATITHRFKSASILGIDSSAEMLEKSKEYEKQQVKIRASEHRRCCSFRHKMGFGFQ
ncbi:Trans-aconitate 2-methyltransferase [Sphingobacterium daejeonense]|nr:Trans-aconitate 2-methyltransferase [Sphingobacterium daejeonense]